jgi:hypothetical protein
LAAPDPDGGISVLKIKKILREILSNLTPNPSPE